MYKIKKFLTPLPLRSEMTMQSFMSFLLDTFGGLNNRKESLEKK
jgi:hypothetical protein